MTYWHMEHSPARAAFREAAEALSAEFGGWPKRPLTVLNRNGTRDMRLRFNRFHQRLDMLVSERDKALEREAVFEKEISRRRFPKALRPTHVFRADGAHMSWEKWLASPSLEMSGLLFEDGNRAGLVQPTA